MPTLTAPRAGTFKIQLQDAPGTAPQAGESAYQWRGNRVEVIRDDGLARVVVADGSGMARIEAGASPRATLTNVTQTVTSRSPLIWRQTTGGRATVTPQSPATVVLSARLRMSIWAMSAPFCVTKQGADILLDEHLLALLGTAGVDDLSLVTTIGWDTRDRPTDRAKPPKWHDGFVPLVSQAHREPYLRKLIGALHPRIQVIPGFSIVKGSSALGANASQADTDRENAYNARARDFANWLRAASPAEIEDYARSINHFFESRGLLVDGIGFDVEIDAIGPEHRDNLGLLYRKTSEAMAHRNGVVSYATAPFVKDGVGMKHVQAQPFSTAATGLNLLARPMCYDASRSTSVADIVTSVACALRPYRDRYDVDSRVLEGGGGLHPSQVQFALWTDKVDVAKLCTTVLRPNRVGLMLYRMPVDQKGAEKFLTDCQTWNNKLNPGEASNGQPGQPLQVPRGFGGWPAQHTDPRPPR